MHLVPCELPEAEERLPRAQIECSHQILSAIGNLTREELIRRRGAMGDRRDHGALQCKPIAAMHRGRLVCDSGAKEGREEPVAAAVAGEDAPCAIAAVGSGRESDDQTIRLGVSEVGDRPAPIWLILECPALLLRNPFSPRDKSRTPEAADNIAIEVLRLVHLQRLAQHRNTLAPKHRP